MILLIDALDSFTYNLVQAFETLGAEVLVRRIDEIDLAGAQALRPEAVILSPGPGHPLDCATHMAIARSEWEVPLLGVCLGHQALVAGSGGAVIHAPEPLHGETSVLTHDGEGLFTGLPTAFEVGRYHSLAADPATLPDRWRITARSGDGVIQGIAHRHLPRWGVQFHPESILTPLGPSLLANFLHLAGITPGARP